ncbi:MAG: hypothetical protein LBG72_00295 [Spirochaetaceae bacterium]|jgi:hypothetical protein|nr:hypothetical protein [Spirochaetaceae bacterium]
MFWVPVKKALYYVSAAYLAFAVIGLFAFMSIEPAHFGGFADKDAAQDVFFTSIPYPVECPAVSVSKEHTFSTPRQYLPRMALPAVFFARSAGLLCAAAGFINRTAAHNQKSAILLKLRI